MNTAELSRVCRQVRRDIINMTANAGSGHPGGSLSAVELMVSYEPQLAMMSEWSIPRIPRRRTATASC